MGRREVAHLENALPSSFAGPSAAVVRN